MNDTELRVNAMANEYQQTIVMLSQRCTVLAAELASAQAKIAELTKPVEVPVPSPSDVQPLKAVE